MTGKRIRVTPVAGSATAPMGNGAQDSVAVAAAPSPCHAPRTTPLDLLEQQSGKSKALVEQRMGCDQDAGAK